MCEVRCIDAQAVSRVRAAMPPVDALTRTADVLRLVGDVTRLRLLAALASGEELCVCDLALVLRATVSQSAVSHALRALRHVGLVNYRKAGTIAYYRLAGDSASAFVAGLLAGADGHAPRTASGPATRRRGASA
jgi:DNA-binding transcriptional ArsR family regulator